MGRIWRSFWEGWRAAAGLWPVVLLLWLVDTGLALVLTIPAAARLGDVLGHSAMAPDLLGPVTINLLTEATGGESGSPPPPGPLYLLVPGLSMLVGTFLRGGTLGALARGSRSFRWTEFFSDCARYFGRLLLLLLFLLPGLLVVGLLFLLLNGTVLRLSSDESLMVATMVRLALLAFLGLLLLTALDYARISLVLEPERSLVRHAGSGLGFLVRRFPQVVILGVAFALLAALLALVYPAFLQLSPLFGALVPALLLQQLSALLLSWQRVATLGGEMALYRSVRRPDPVPPSP